MKKKIYTKGNVLVNEIKVGDVHYEFFINMGVKCRVLTYPEIDLDGVWFWESKNLKTGEVINYAVNPDYPQSAPNLYDYEAYAGVKYY
jgi:hypothetical protein